MSFDLFLWNLCFINTGDAQSFKTTGLTKIVVYSGLETVPMGFFIFGLNFD